MLKSSWRTFLDENNVEAGEGGQALAKVSRIDISGPNPLLREAHIRVACDVNNPLCGEIGSTYVYGPQKGVTENQKKQLDEDMAHFAQITSPSSGNGLLQYPWCRCCRRAWLRLSLLPRGDADAWDRTDSECCRTEAGTF